MINYDQIMTILMAVIIVVLGLYFSMKLYIFWVGYQVPEMSLEIFDDKLRRLGSWKTYYLIKYKFVRISEQVYQFNVEFDFNNLPQLLKMLADSKNQQIADSVDISVFNTIVDKIDQTTKPVESELLTLEDSREIDSFTKTLLGVDDRIPIDQVPNKSSEIDDLYRFLDLLDTDINLSNRLRVKIHNRLLTMKIPLLQVGKDTQKTDLKFDPNYFMNTSTYNQVVNISVYNDRMVISPSPNKTMIVKFD